MHECAGSAGSAVFAAVAPAFWEELAAAAEPEWWGAGHTVLRAYLPAAFDRAAQQGKLLLRPAASGDGQPLLHFATGLLSPGLQQVVLTFERRAGGGDGAGSAAAAAAGGAAQQAPWQLHGVYLDSAAGAQAVAPAAPLPAVFNAGLAVEVGVDALLQGAGARALLGEHLMCCGVQLPEASWEGLVRGGVEASLRLLRASPRVALPRLAAAGAWRVEWLVPLRLMRGEPVRLVLVLEQHVGVDGRQFYACSGMEAFEVAYVGLRAWDQVSWPDPQGGSRCFLCWRVGLPWFGRCAVVWHHHGTAHCLRSKIQQHRDGQQ